MKKIMAILSVLMCCMSINSYAQLKEVRGVQTRVVTYYDTDWKEELHGFEFKNENNYSVWVEAELVTQGFTVPYNDHPHVEGGTRDTKNFTLKPGETYVWKCGGRMVWLSHDFYDRYFVKYKAYKAE